MFLITKRYLIQRVAERWKKNYPDLVESWPGTKLSLLKLLDVNTATEKQVADIIGNDSWTKIRCDECRKDVPVAVVMGNPDSKRLCRTCLKKALHLLNPKQENPKREEDTLFVRT